jgi:hypothetical protein
VKNPADSTLMKAVALTANFDGENVQLDEPFQLEANARLVVVILPPEDERQTWSRFSASQLSRAYSQNEPEYTAADLRP